MRISPPQLFPLEKQYLAIILTNSIFGFNIFSNKFQSQNLLKNQKMNVVPSGTTFILGSELGGVRDRIKLGLVPQLDTKP